MSTPTEAQPTEAACSPRPWHVNRNDSCKDVILSGDTVVARTTRDIKAYRANAALICRAVNERAGLIAALEAAERQLAANLIHGCASDREAVMQIRAALADTKS